MNITRVLFLILYNTSEFNESDFQLLYILMKVKLTKLKINDILYSVTDIIVFLSRSKLREKYCQINILIFLTYCCNLKHM